MTVARRLLIHVAVGAAFVILVVAALTYVLVFRAAEQRAIEHLNTYVAERTRREVAGFQTTYNNLELLRGQFLKRDALPSPPDLQARWDEVFERYPDGAWRNRETHYDPRQTSNLWFHRDGKLTPKLQERLLRAQELCEEVEAGWIDTFPSVYFIFPGPSTMGFDPRIPRWSWQTPADYDLEKEEWFLAATPERNPTRTFAWTGVFVDEATNTPFCTVLLPIERNGEYIGLVAHDTHINQLFNEVSRSDFEGATHLIFRPDGRLIVHPRLRAEILASNGGLKAEQAGDPSLASLYRLCVAHPERQFSGLEPVSDSYFSASRLPAAEWFFVTTMPRATVRAQAFRAAQWVWLSGLASLALMFASFATILRRQVTLPLAELTRATKAMRDGGEAPRPAARADELGDFAGAFREMVDRVANRDAELRALNQDLELRVADRTAALDSTACKLRAEVTERTRAEEELQRSLARERELGEMKSVFVSVVSHEFRTPLGVIMSATEVLQRYYERLTPEKREHHLAMIFRSTRGLAQLIDEVLLLGRVEEGRMAFEPIPLDLEKLCRSLCDELRSATSDACPIHFQATGSLSGAVSDEGLLRHVLCNVLSNAIKYSEPDSEVQFNVARVDKDAVITIRDRGIGISPEDQARLFTSFTRGRNVGERPGTGLGLVIVKRCVELHGGRLELISAPGSGTVVTINLPLFCQSAPEPA